jgi:hypothetical protein
MGDGRRRGSKVFAAFTVAICFVAREAAAEESDLHRVRAAVSSG